MDIVGVTVVTKKVYITSDKKEFLNEKEALDHEKELQKRKVFILIKSVIAIGATDFIEAVYEDENEAKARLEFLMKHREPNVSYSIKKHYVIESKVKKQTFYVDNMPKISNHPFVLKDYSTDATANITLQNK